LVGPNPLTRIGTVF